MTSSDSLCQPGNAGGKVWGAAEGSLTRKTKGNNKGERGSDVTPGEPRREATRVALCPRGRRHVPGPVQSLCACKAGNGAQRR